MVLKPSESCQGYSTLTNQTMTTVSRDFLGLGHFSRLFLLFRQKRAKDSDDGMLWQHRRSLSVLLLRILNKYFSSPWTLELGYLCFTNLTSNFIEAGTDLL